MAVSQKQCHVSAGVKLHVAQKLKSPPAQDSAGDWPGALEILVLIVAALLGLVLGRVLPVPVSAVIGVISVAAVNSPKVMAFLSTCPRASQDKDIFRTKPMHQAKQHA